MAIREIAVRTAVHCGNNARSDQGLAHRRDFPCRRSPSEGECSHFGFKCWKAWCVRYGQLIKSSYGDSAALGRGPEKLESVAIRKPALRLRSLQEGLHFLSPAWNLRSASIRAETGSRRESRPWGAGSNSLTMRIVHRVQQPAKNFNSAVCLSENGSKLCYTCLKSCGLRFLITLPPESSILETAGPADVGSRAGDSLLARNSRSDESRHRPARTTRLGVIRNLLTVSPQARPKVDGIRRACPSVQAHEALLGETTKRSRGLMPTRPGGGRVAPAVAARIAIVARQSRLSPCRQPRERVRTTKALKSARSVRHPI